MPSATPGSGSPLGEEGVPGGTGGMPSGSGIDEELANEVLEERSGPYGTGSAVRRAGADGGVVTEGIGEDLRADYRAERRAAKAEKQAEMEEAHANGQPYLWEETTDWRGNEVEVWIYPDGTEVTTTPPDANGQREVLDVEYAGDSHPVFLGQIPVDGEYVSVFEIPPWNTVIVVDADGNSLGTLEEFDDRIMTVDAAMAAQAYGLDVDDLGDTDGGTVNLMWQPMGPPTYDTQLVNADTGEVIITDNSGVQFDATTATMAGYPPEDGPYTQYQAPGNNEYYIVVSADGEIVNAYVDQPDEEWSVLWGLVTHYEDGTTTVDLGPLEFDVDIEGPEVGGAVRVDVGVAEVELGGRYNVENGSWEVNFSASADIGVASGSLDMTVGEDADGHAYFDLEAEVEFMVGPVGVGLGAGVHYYETDDGYMLDVHAEGSASLLGAYAEAGWQGTIVADSEGAMVTQSTYVGAGIEGVGGIRLTGQSQVTFNEDGQVTGWTSGAGLSAVDREGDELGMIGVFGNDDGENWTDNEWLDTGFRERDTRPALPGAPGQDGIDDAASVMDDDPATTGPR
ncbi:MAG TPA: hypothetical protein DCR14_09875, partial [Acidimicrobiaceae bacterium]|nr:hypothetical protein [Acidimicrobiaceae bacterium]